MRRVEPNTQDSWLVCLLTLAMVSEAKFCLSCAYGQSDTAMLIHLLFAYGMQYKAKVCIVKQHGRPNCRCRIRNAQY